MSPITLAWLFLALIAAFAIAEPRVASMAAQNELLNKSLDNVDEEVNLSEIMLACNESFRIRLDYIQEFNSSGSLPDESDRTPMCFMRCVLEKAQILSDGILNKSRVGLLLWPATGDSVEACQAEGDLEEHPCTKAYAISRCMMTRALVDAKNTTAD